MRYVMALIVFTTVVAMVAGTIHAGESEVVSGSAEKLKLGGYVQARFVHNSDQDEDSFSIPRARIGASGEVIENVYFKLQGDFGKGKVKMTDGYIKLIHRENPDLTIGQFKVPYSPEVMSSSSKLDLIDRPVISSALGPDRDIGLMVHGTLMDGRIGLWAGAWNGNGANHSSNDNDRLLYGARIAREALAGDEMKLTLGLGAYTSEDASVELKHIGEFAGDRASIGADAAIEYGPIMFKAEYHTGSLDPVAETDPETGLTADVGEYDVDGLFVRTGYMILENRLQVVAQYETFNNEAAEDIDGISLGLNYFWAKHNHKAQIVYVRMNDAESEDEIQVQIQIKF